MLRERFELDCGGWEMGLSSNGLEEVGGNPTLKMTLFHSCFDVHPLCTSSHLFHTPDSARLAKETRQERFASSTPLFASLAQFKTTVSPVHTQCDSTWKHIKRGGVTITITTITSSTITTIITTNLITNTTNSITTTFNLYYCYYVFLLLFLLLLLLLFL